MVSAAAGGATGAAAVGGNWRRARATLGRTGRGFGRGRAAGGWGVTGQRPSAVFLQLQQSRALPMTFRQRYAQLQDADFVRRMMLRSVYGTMALENQTVPMERLALLYDKVERERMSKASSQTDGAGRE
jgi:hypothetical protein